MKAALLYKVGDLRVVEIEKPKVGPDDVLVKIKACGVCPTDIRKYKTGNHGVPKLPMNLGHEWTGDVVEIGENVEGFRLGMRVVGGGYVGYAEYANIDEWAMKYKVAPEIPPGVSYEEATFAEPLADCIHAVVEQGKAEKGKTVVIIGAGHMGIMQSKVAKNVGATVIVSGHHEARLRYAERFGADHLINSSQEDPVERVKELTDGEGADAVIVSIGNALATTQGLEMAGKFGRVVLFGGAPHGTTVTFDPNIIHYGEIALVGSSWIGLPPRQNVKLYNEALDLMASKQVPVGELITHRFPLDKILEAFEATKDRTSYLKAMIIP